MNLTPNYLAQNKRDSVLGDTREENITNLQHAVIEKTLPASFYGLFCVAESSLTK
jgi:hypothetical protein